MRVLLLPLLLCTLVACDIPRDPDGTLERVREGVLRAGYTEAEPWAMGEPSDPQGVEVDIVEAFAEGLGAQVEWTRGSQAELFAALEVRALDLVVGGFDASDPLVATAAPTRPYATTRLTVGVPPGDAPPEDLQGRTIAVEPATEALGLLRKAGARPEVVEDITQSQGLAAVEQWMLDDLGLVDSGHHLAESKHVMAVPLGENAWLVELERYLFVQRERIAGAIKQMGPA